MEMLDCVKAQNSKNSPLRSLRTERLFDFSATLRLQLDTKNCLTFPGNSVHEPMKSGCIRPQQLSPGSRIRGRLQGTLPAAGSETCIAYTPRERFLFRLHDPRITRCAGTQASTFALPIDTWRRRYFFSEQVSAVFSLLFCLSQCSKYAEDQKVILNRKTSLWQVSEKPWPSWNVSEVYQNVVPGPTRYDFFCLPFEDLKFLRNYCTRGKSQETVGATREQLTWRQPQT